MLNYKTVSVTAMESRKQTSHFDSETLTVNKTATLNSCTLQSLKTLLGTFNVAVSNATCYYKCYIKVKNSAYMCSKMFHSLQYVCSDCSLYSVT